MLISILMPTRSEEPWLAEALDSVLKQTWQDWQLLVAPEAWEYQPGTAQETAFRYARNDRRIQVIPRWGKNIGGYAKGFNWCLRHASGDVYARLDADDAYEPAFLEVMAGLMADGWLLASAEKVCIDESGNALRGRHNRRRSGQMDPAKLGRGEHCCFNPSVVAQREVYGRVGYFDPAFEFAADEEWNLRALRAGYLSWGYVEEPLLYRYRRHPNSMSQLSRAESNECFERALAEHRKG